MSQSQHVTPLDMVLAGALSPGTCLAGNFEIVSVVGQGGMAVVYTAIQKSLDRRVAIKVLHHRFAGNSEFVSRFEAESGALASLSHPNIVNIIDRGHDKNLYFFVMEHVEGKTLDQLILDNALNHGDWKRVIDACCNGIEYVHKRGIVHRDIKPSNILMGSEDSIKISDFGIAHILAGTELKVQLGTDKPRAIGTAHYMAPEQTSDPASVDHRADVYSLGVTFYKMMARAIPRAESLRNPSDVNSDVPAAADKILLKALAPNREMRYQSVREFCTDLQKALKDRSTSITSVLNSGKHQPGMSLYSGEDFRPGAPPIDHTPTPRNLPRDPSTPRNRTGKDTTREEVYSSAGILERLTPMPVRNLTPPPVAPAATPRPVAANSTPAPMQPRNTPRPVVAAAPANPTPKPVTGKVATTASAALAAHTPMPTPAAQSSSSSPRLLMAMAGFAAFLGVGLLGVIGYLAFKPVDEPEVLPPPVMEFESTVTEQRQRALEQVLRERGELPPEDNSVGNIGDGQ